MNARLRPGADALAFSAAYLALALLSIALSRQPGQLAHVWYPNALAMAWLMLRPRAVWPRLLAVMAVTNALANLAWGDTWAVALVLAPANLLEVVLGAWLLQRAGIGSATLASATGLLRLLLLGGLLPPLASATAAVLCLHLLGGAGALGGLSLWLAWVESAVIGSASLLALAVLLLGQPWARSRASLADARLWLMLAVTVAGALLSLAHLPFPFVFLGIPLLVAALLLDLLAVTLLAWAASLTVTVALANGVFVPPPVTAEWQQALVYVACTAALVPPQLLAASIAALRDSHAGLLARKAELRVANEGLQQFVRIASHDLREPLNTIAQFSGLVLSDHGGQLPPDARRWLGLVSDEAQRMRVLLDDVLQYAQVRPEDLPAPQPVPLDAVVQQALQGLSGRLHSTQAQVQVDAALPVVRGHASLLALLLQNLLSNALKFQPPGQRPEVAVSAERADGQVALTVRDNGIGIPPEEQSRVFEPFHRLHRRAAYEGSGLGLALCRQIAQAHGGQLLLQSTPGQGSRFTVLLPAAG